MNKALRLVLLLAVALLPPAAAVHAAGAAKPPSVIFFMPAGSADNPFILMAEKGILAAAGLHPEVKVARVYPYSTEFIGPYVEFVARKGHDYVIGVGGYYAEAFRKVAPTIPDCKFILIDGSCDAPNVKSLVFDDYEGGYLAGLVAGVATSAGRVGFLGAVDDLPAVKEFERGYRDGVARANPDAKIDTAHIGKTPAAFDDRAGGYERANKLYRAGCDVLFAVAGTAGFGCIDAARDRRKFVIGVDADVDARAVGRVLTSVVKRIDVAVLAMVGDIAEGRFDPAPVHYHAGNDGFALTAFQYSAAALGKERLDKIRDLAAEFLRRHPDSRPSQLRLGGTTVEKPVAPVQKKKKGGKRPRR